MTIPACAIDFGTSNSTVGLHAGSFAGLIPVEDDKLTIPSAIFFSSEPGPVRFGRAAIAEYLDGEPGRLMRALKSLMGSRLFMDRTAVQGRYVRFAEILAMFLRRLKEMAEAKAGREIDRVVLGRPVTFVDGDETQDRQAETDLEASATAAGFRHIAFQLEPIAAALEYESRVAQEELVFIADIGGGTSDFSVVRVSPAGPQKADRRDDVLANGGVRIGGTDFDRILALRHVMPHLGMGSTYSPKRLEVPRGPYVDLATWSRVNFLYDGKTLRDIATVTREADRPELMQRLVSVIERKSGHRLIGEVEAAKIALSDATATTIDLTFVEAGLAAKVSKSQMDVGLRDAMERTAQTITATVARAGVKPDRIDTVFLTGGSAQLPLVQATVAAYFPRATITRGDMLASVGKGLVLDARRKFA